MDLLPKEIKIEFRFTKLQFQEILKQIRVLKKYKSLSIATLDAVADKVRLIFSNIEKHMKLPDSKLIIQQQIFKNTNERMIDNVNTIQEIVRNIPVEYTDYELSNDIKILMDQLDEIKKSLINQNHFFDPKTQKAAVSKAKLHLMYVHGFYGVPIVSMDDENVHTNRMFEYNQEDIVQKRTQKQITNANIINFQNQNLEDLLTQFTDTRNMQQLISL